MRSSCFLPLLALFALLACAEALAVPKPVGTKAAQAATRPSRDVPWLKMTLIRIEPTEAEWEYAARAGKSGPVAGTGRLDEMAWYADNSGRQPLDSAKLWDTDPNNYFGKLSENGCGPRAVGTGMPNDWGIHDMEGNTAEWVMDWYSADYFRDDVLKIDPQGPVESSLGSRVMRGGSWGSDPRNCRIAHREWNVPSFRSGSCGFRVVMESE